MGLAQLNFAGYNKVEVAIMRIQQFEPSEGYNLAFSGGKDSEVVKDLATKSGVKYTAFMNWTGIDPPELYHFVQEYYPEVEIRKPEKSMWKLIQEHRMLPTRLIRFCCEQLKERSVKSGTLLTGIRWQESANRRKRKMVEVSYKNKAVRFVHPVIDWTEGEVWEYIRRWANLSWCELYNIGFKRIGCILCPFTREKGIQLEIKRYPKYALMWLRACERLVADPTFRNPKGFKDGRELFEWWLTREHLPKKDELQCTFFGD